MGVCCPELMDLEALTGTTMVQPNKKHRFMCLCLEFGTDSHLVTSNVRYDNAWKGEGGAGC